MTGPAAPGARPDRLPRLRLALALGDQEREQRLRPALDADEELAVAAQCLAGDQLLEAVESRRVDAVVVAWGLHRLSEPILAQLQRAGLPLVVLAPDPAAERWSELRGVVLPLDADAAAVRQALSAAWRGERFTLDRRRPAAEEATPPPAAASPLAVLAVTGGHGSPGRTTVAINLAAALGAVAPTVLVDADLSGPSVAAYLDRDPSRNLCTLAHAVRDNSHAWARVIADEAQPLGPRSPHGVVLCGLPKREMRAGLSPAFLERLVAELRRRYRYVVLDVGSEWLGSDPAASAHRGVLTGAGHLLLVTSADLVGLWHTRAALGLLEAHLQLDRRRVSLVINRHDRRHHHARDEIEWHLGLGAAAVIPHDQGGAQRAIGAQRPLILDPGSRAGRALVGLAERVHRGEVRIPPEVDGAGRGDWLRRLLPARLTAPARQPAWPDRGEAC